MSDSDKVVLWESPDKILVLPNSEGRAFFYKTAQVPTGLYLFSSLWRLAVESVGVRVITDRWVPFVVWTLEDRGKFLELMTSVFPPIVQIMPAFSSITPRRTLVCSAGGQPFGDYFYKMASRAPRYISLLIMFFGHRNAAPCTHCAKRYAGTSATYQSGDDEEITHVNYPFFYCISHPLINNGKCANCVYHVCSDCEYNTNNPDFANFQCISSRAARADKSPKKPPKRHEESMILSDPIDWRAIRKTDRQNQKKTYQITDNVKVL